MKKSIPKRKEIIFFSPLKILLLSRYKHGKNKGKVWGNKVTQNYVCDSTNLSSIYNNLVLSREELFNWLCIYYVTSVLGDIETQTEIL